MPIAGTKAELLQAMEEEHRRLKECLNGLDAVAAGERGVCGEWSAKDVVAHLVAWKQRGDAGDGPKHLKEGPVSEGLVSVDASVAARALDRGEHQQPLSLGKNPHSTMGEFAGPRRGTL